MTLRKSCGASPVDLVHVRPREHVERSSEPMNRGENCGTKEWKGDCAGCGRVTRTVGLQYSDGSFAGQLHSRRQPVSPSPLQGRLRGFGNQCGARREGPK